jgi:uncharacterized membrane protein HdeD (DUF308 family)
MSQPGAPRDPLGVVSLILGLVALITSWVVIGIFFGLAAIVTGSVGRSRAKRIGMPGAGVATAGMVLGVLSIMAAVAAVIGYLWFYHHQTEQQHRCKVFDTYQPC